MQRESTLQFWDDYHNENDSKEWILLPSVELLELIHSHCPKSSKSLQMIEIGCGTSTMARELWHHIQNNEDRKVHMCATDVSPVCIQISQERDKSIIQDSNKDQQVATSSTLAYQVLNVVDGQPHGNLPWEVILDKGCLDTFLFRTRQRGENHAYTNLLQNVLDNLWSWMTDDGVYLLISPRPKLKAVRDYSGFASVERFPMTMEASKGSLVGNGNEKSRNMGYIYVCRKNSAYIIGETAAFKANWRDLPPDDRECPHCGMTFLELRKGEAVDGRGVVFWTRQWKGHCIHCKAPHKSPYSQSK